MTIWKRWIQRSVLCGLLLTGLVGCSMVAHPSVSQIALTDHAGMAAWYEEEASTNRQKAKDMAVMQEAYEKNPSFVRGMAGLGGKTDILRHCELLIDSYTKAAEEADQFAKMHRDMMK